MQDILLTYQGKYLRTGDEFSGGNRTHLLHNDENFEATIDIIPKGTVGCLYSLPKEDFEFNYILEGTIELCGIKEKTRLGVGDTFTYYILKKNYMFRALEDTKTLCIRKTPCYSAQVECIDNLNKVLSKLQEADGDTLSHCERVKELSMGIAYFMDFDQSRLLDLFYASKFHDVGKSKIPLDILLKPGKLTNEEFEIMKKHSRYTYEMILEYYGEVVAEIAFEHHERLDGKGYPRGLKGDEIGMPARIICVADAYDAMTVRRPYRNPLSRQEALTELHRWENIQFDPSVIKALEIHLNEAS